MSESGLPIQHPLYLSKKNKYYLEMKWKCQMRMKYIPCLPCQDSSGNVHKLKTNVQRSLSKAQYINK